MSVREMHPMYNSGEILAEEFLKPLRISHAVCCPHRVRSVRLNQLIVRQALASRRIPRWRLAQRLRRRRSF